MEKHDTEIEILTFAGPSQRVDGLTVVGKVTVHEAGTITGQITHDLMLAMITETDSQFAIAISPITARRAEHPEADLSPAEEKPAEPEKTGVLGDVMRFNSPSEARQYGHELIFAIEHPEEERLTELQVAVARKELAAVKAYLASVDESL